MIVKCYRFELDFLEFEFIEIHNTIAPKGYNLYPGGKKTYNGHSGSSRDKISANQRKHFDGVNDLPRYVMFVPKGEHGEGYAVSSPEIEFMQFSSMQLTLDEKYDFAIKYLIGDTDRHVTREQYNSLKNERKIAKIAKTVNISGEEFILPSYFMWCPSEKFFLVRKPEKKAKQFGDSRITVRENYNKALKYYNS